MGQLTLVFSIENRSCEITIKACPICPKRKEVVKCGLSVLPVTRRAVQISTTPCTDSGVGSRTQKSEFKRGINPKSKYMEEITI